MSKPPAGSIVMVALTVVLGISLVGFLRATRVDDYTFETPLRELPQQTPTGTVEPAIPYTAMRDRVPGKRPPVLASDLLTLQRAVPGRAEPVEPASTDKRSALAERATRRAYFGAPPVIPHPVRQRGQAECPACHEAGIRIRGKAAPPYPHDGYVSCTQCHAMAEPNLPWDPASVGPDPRDVPNRFVGEDAPLRGERWTAIAPPKIPHPTFMHERCISCHGPNGRDALKSTHPERQNCQQCHPADASLAALDGRP